MPSSYIGYAVNFGHEETQVRDTPCDCSHLEYHDEVLVREDGFTACIPCDIALTGFETIYGDSIDEMEVLC